jgi:N-acetylneuraminate synthase
MSSWNELDRAVTHIRKHHNILTILQCTSEYPCPYERVGLNIMRDIGERYGVPIGLSDHTMTSYASLAAVSLGASIIEKHFTLSRRMYGSDARHSLEPDEFRVMVDGVRAIELMLHSPVDKDDTSQVRGMKEIFEKSIVAGVDIPKGTKIVSSMLKLKKPGTGIPSYKIDGIIGKTAVRNIERDTILSDSDFIS